MDVFKVFVFWGVLVGLCRFGGLGGWVSRGWNEAGIVVQVELTLKGIGFYGGLVVILWL